MASFDFDLFLSHNSRDKPAVVQLRYLLRQRELKVWLAQEQLPPGHNWIPLLKQGLDNSGAIAVCVGAHGVGPWQDQEVQEALRVAVRDKRPVIPVYLPSAKDVEVTVPDFVDLRTFVDFRNGFTEEALDNLVFGVTGRRPQRVEPTRRLGRLPRQFHFFGREQELATVREALDPARRTWGALIDGTGGIGKTALAIRAAYEAPEEWFQRVCFVSVKAHELTPEGKQARPQFATPTWRDMLIELAGELDLREVAQRTPDDKLASLLERALREMPTLLVLDNLESLLPDDLQRLYEFLGVLPQGCKAIVTSRRRSDLDVRTVRLERLEQAAALALIASLAEDRPALRRATESERLSLYTETGGNPLLIRWIAGQLGRGKCHTIASALHLLKEAPSGPDNDPLHFIMGDLVDEFTDPEAAAITALMHFTKPVEVRHIAELAGLSVIAARTALEDLSYRALVNPEPDYQRFVLAPLVGDYLRRVKPELVSQVGQRLASRGYALAVENGYKVHSRFPVLEDQWDLLEAALPLLLAGANDRLQTACDALKHYLDFTGRWKVYLDLSLKAEERALQAGDFAKAGWRAHDVGWVFQLLGNSVKVLACAERAAQHWQQSCRQNRSGTSEQAAAIRLRGTGRALAGDHKAAIVDFRLALDLWRSIGPESFGVSVALNGLAMEEMALGQLDAAERDYGEALRLAEKFDRQAEVGVKRPRSYGEAWSPTDKVDNSEAEAAVTGNLAELALKQQDWIKAEKRARKAILLAEAVGRRQLIGSHHHSLAVALLRQSRTQEALPHAQQATQVLGELPGSPGLAGAQATLKEVRLELSLAKHLPGWTFNSNALEGNTLTLAEVTQVLADPQAEIAGKRREELVEARNHAAALQQMAEIIKKGREFSADDLFALHTTLMQGTVVDIFKPVGQWKVETNETVVKLEGKPVINANYAAPAHVDRLMKSWLEELNRRLTSRSTALEDYVWLHATFARIHPFADGNGRLARLLANVPVYSKAQDPIIISVTMRDRYLAALATWQIACGPPLPGRFLLEKRELLTGFQHLCDEAVAAGATG